ncbi:putattive exported protein [Bordetella trematum]|uniref:Bug family tripartite tricarboxylate transporter substrate binding protein n=1 Tax=Bordetella trematum TaxID=123899 RepID=UPI000471A056|nr:tripartite tricarboxylate transporter substrate binding protein [Bordetella trematum]AUL48041.1 MFS transporter [Bordetella trematum]QIM69989.1 tripartite tricarboxylate transporter substrate binding protein [Bordetella trematum]SAI56147.1 putattive exported protein [Bordetella trematum]
MKKNQIKLAGVAAALAMAAISPVQAQADAYPNKPVRLVVGYAPGGTTDISARMIAERLGKALGQTFVVENKPGANSNIGAENVVRSPADGYTLFVGSISTAINQSLYSKMSFDAVKDLEPVAMLNVVPNILVVNPDVPVKTVQEYIDYAKKNPGQLTCASPGNGSSAHLGCELFKLKTGIDVLHVPYRGSGPAVADLLGGQVNSIFDNMPPLLPQVRSGKLNGLAVTMAERVPFAKEIPTIAESGVPGFDVAAWFGVFAPAGTPPEIVQKLNTAINDAVYNDASMISNYEANGFLPPPPPNTPETFKAFMGSEVNKWGEVVKAVDLQIN